MHLPGITALLALVLSIGCAGTWGDRGLATTYVASSALVACDVGQTIWASDGGRWDRMAPDGRALGERNPLLGQTPGPDTLLAIAVGNAIGGAILLQSDAPRWLKWAWFGSVTAMEVINVPNNARHGLGTCGVSGTDVRVTTRAAQRRSP